MSSEKFDTEEFFRFVRRRRLMLAAGGIVSAVPGLIGLQFAARSLAVWFAALALLGAFLLAAAFSGVGMLRQARELLTTQPRTMQLTTAPLATTRWSLPNKQLRVSLDRSGSPDSTPIAEFRAVWFSPGPAETPARQARVYGALDHRQPVLAVTADGSCYLGRISRTQHV